MISRHAALTSCARCSLFPALDSFAAVQGVSASGKICILDIDVQGVRSVQSAGSSVLDPHYLFIAAPSLEILEARLRGRCEMPTCLARRHIEGTAR